MGNTTSPTYIIIHSTYPLLQICLMDLRLNLYFQLISTYSSINQDPSSAAANRLMEMGFPRDKVMAALISNNNNEEAALNSLLS